MPTFGWGVDMKLAPRERDLGENEISGVQQWYHRYCRCWKLETQFSLEGKVTLVLWPKDTTKPSYQTDISVGSLFQYVSIYMVLLNLARELANDWWDREEFQNSFGETGLNSLTKASKHLLVKEVIDAI